MKLPIPVHTTSKAKSILCTKKQRQQQNQINKPPEKVGHALQFQRMTSTKVGTRDGNSMRPDGHTLEAESEQEVEPSSQLHRKKRLESERMTHWRREVFTRIGRGWGMKTLPFIIYT